MEKVLNISGKSVGFRATALSPKLYRLQTGRDLLLDLKKMTANIKNGESGTESLECLDDFGYCLAKQYAKCHGEDIPDTAEEWLDQFELLDIYSIYPELVQLWAISNQTTAIPQKKTSVKR